MTINIIKHARKFEDIDHGKIIEGCDVSIPLIKRLRLDESSSNNNNNINGNECTGSTTWSDEVCQYRLSKLRISKQKRSAESSIDSPTGSMPMKKLSRYAEIDEDEKSLNDLTDTFEEDSMDRNGNMINMNELLRELHFLRLERLAEKTRMKELTHVS